MYQYSYYLSKHSYKKLFLEIVLATFFPTWIRNVINKNESWRQYFCSDSVAFWKDGICLVFFFLVSYTWYMQLFGGPHGTQHRGPPTTAGVCGWPVTWPPGAPVMAELDPQWHLSEKLLLQGSGVGSDGMGCGNGWANAAKKNWWFEQ